MKNLTWQNPEQLFVAQELINKIKSKCCGIKDGVNITTVQKLLGHKSVKTTQVYTNVMDMTIVHDLEKNHALMPLPKKTRT